MKKHKLTATALAAGMAMLAGNAMAHDPLSAGAGTVTCLESNLMVADAQNEPFASAKGKGRVLEMNTTTGTRGLTVGNPFTGSGGPVCEPDNVGGPNHVDCPGPFKPTGILSGGQDGHAFLVSAAQHALVEHHRNATKIRTSPVWPTSPSQTGGGWGYVPRLLGNGFMPNGNIAQTVCDANFFNASNSDPLDANTESAITYNAFPPNPVPSSNSSYLYFPPVYGTTARSGNGRVLVVDQDTLGAIDEYTKPTGNMPYADDPRWNCPAGVIFTSEGMFVSMFHGDAVFVIDWKAGVDKESRGTGANKALNCGSSSDDDGDNCQFKIGKKKNQAVVLRVIDVSNDGTLNTGYALNYDDSATNYDSGHRRDNLRAIRMSEDGTLWGTRRSRSEECLRGQAPGAVGPNAGVCHPGVFRQHIFAVDPNSNTRSGSIALDPGVNILAGVTINRMSGPGCKFITGLDPTTVPDDACNVETLYVGVSAGNAGCPPVGQPPASPNSCFEPRSFKGDATGWDGTGGGGTIYEYRIDKANWDDTTGLCTGVPGGSNTGCALPIAQFVFLDVPGGTVEKIDPRMVMTVHEAFVQ